MRICFLEGDMSRAGGTERMTAWLANGLVGKYEVSVVSLAQQGELFYTLNAGVDYRTVPCTDPVFIRQ